MKIFVSLMLFLGCGTACFAQAAGTLDTALTNAKFYVESQLARGAKVLVADAAAPSKELGAYIAEGLSARLVNSRKLTVVERNPDVIAVLNSESAYQLSGEVSDESVQLIGYKTGAEVIVTGALRESGGQYRLSLKITALQSGELQGQWYAAFQSDPVLDALLARARPPVVKPAWISQPVANRAQYESSRAGVSEWYYDVGVSNKAASEQLARTRARQNVQEVIAANIASEMQARIDIQSLSIFQASSIEDASYRVEAALTNSIKTTVPRYEALEWYVETGRQDGKDYYIAYVLVRFARKDIMGMVERLDPGRAADTVIRQMNISVQETRLRSEFVQELAGARDYALEGIRDGYTDR